MSDVRFQPNGRAVDRIHFTHFGESKTIHVAIPARVDFILQSLEIYPHVETVDMIPGIFKITAMKDDLPKRKVWFKLELLESHLPKEKVVSQRYDGVE